MRYICTSAIAALVMTSFVSAETHTVWAFGGGFQPATVVVAPGDTIIWESIGSHTVTSGDPCTADGLFNGEISAAGDTFTWDVPLDASGDIPYFCQPHCDMGMTGVIIVEEPPNPCPADVDGDGAVDVNDVLAVIGDWGPCPGCGTDTNGDGVVDVNDILYVIAAWGPCP